jgi:hypothetical protein
MKYHVGERTPEGCEVAVIEKDNPGAAIIWPLLGSADRCWGRSGQRSPPGSLSPCAPPPSAL